MPVFEMEVVLNTEFGGFSFDTEMALWLVENRGWTVLPEKQYQYKQKYPINTLVDMRHDHFYSPQSDTIELRSNKDLIDCVRAIQVLHEDDEYPEAYYGHIHKLSIKKVKVHIEVENYHDGKEKVQCWAEEDWDD